MNGHDHDTWKVTIVEGSFVDDKLTLFRISYDLSYALLISIMLSSCRTIVLKNLWYNLLAKSKEGNFLSIVGHDITDSISSVSSSGVYRIKLDNTLFKSVGS